MNPLKKVDCKVARVGEEQRQIARTEIQMVCTVVSAEHGTADDNVCSLAHEHPFFWIVEQDSL